MSLLYEGKGNECDIADTHQIIHPRHAFRFYMRSLQRAKNGFAFFFMTLGTAHGSYQWAVSSRDSLCELSRRISDWRTFYEPFLRNFASSPRYFHQSAASRASRLADARYRNLKKLSHLFFFFAENS